MRILITGGAGYIGSHTVLEAIKRGHDVSIIDNLSNTTWRNIDTITKKNKKAFISKCPPYLTEDYNFDTVIHLAALKSVTQSQRIPFTYTKRNVCDMNEYLEYAREADIPFVLASSAAVYGSGSDIFSVGDKLAPESVYGMNKATCEAMVNGYDKGVILRYFNVAGAGAYIGEEYGRLGNFVPRIYQQEDLQLRKIEGQYPIRDYVHVLDVARINVDCAESKIKGIHNVSSGVGTDIQELVELTGRNDYTEVEGEGEAVKLIGRSDLDLRYNIRDIIKSTNKWYRPVSVF